VSRLAVTLAAFLLAAPAHAGGVSLTWMGVAHMLMETPAGTALLDAYVSRPPFSMLGPTADGLALFQRIVGAVKPGRPIRWIFVGHSHFDHALDVGPLALETGAQVIGSRTTCFIAEAQGLPTDRCTVVAGGETLDLGRLEVRVARIPHSGPSTIGRFEELGAPPATAVAAPNGGNLAFLFRLTNRKGATKLAWAYANSISAIDADDGSDADFAATWQELASGVERPSTWFGPAFGGASLDPYLEVLQPRSFVPLHWGGLTSPIEGGVDAPFASPELEASLAARDATLVVPAQYFDRIKVGRRGARRSENRRVKKALGIPPAP